MEPERIRANPQIPMPCGSYTVFLLVWVNQLGASWIVTHSQADNFRSGEATTLACKPEDYQKMPPEVLRLLGFYKGASGAGGLGGKDPVETWEGLKGYAGGEWLYEKA